MPFLAIILIKCFRAKVTLKKQETARKPANSRPEWGSTPDGRLFKIRELANSILLKLNIVKYSKKNLKLLF